MGKRKRIASHHHDTNNNPTSSDDLLRSSRTELLSKERSSHLIDSSELKSLSPGMDITDSSLKLLNASSSVAHHHYNLGRSVFLKRSRHHYAHQYSRRNSGNYTNASTSHGKGTPLCDERLSFKLVGQYNSDCRHHPESKEKAFFRSERIRSSSLVMDAISSDSVKMVCGICRKLLRRKPCFLGDTLSSGEHSVVAVLVCGHVYHADCLEQRTSLDDRHEPPCPLCLGLRSQEDAPMGQE